MPVRSLGLASDLALIDGEIFERDGYLVVRSPQEPGYYWGNLLVFDTPPSSESKRHWEAHFDREFQDLPDVRHRTFAWDIGGPPAKLDAFHASGYHHERSVVLTTRQVLPPPHPNVQLEIRELQTDSEWASVEALQVVSRDPEHGEEAYRSFVRGRIQRLRARVDAGRGEWYGAYLDGQQVGNLGIVRIGGGGARFQIVVTHPAFRRRGVCGTLVHHVSEKALAHPDVDHLIMLADRDYHAARIYESVGFVVSETLEGVSLWPPIERG